jgi:hypothetical protein
MSKTTLVLVHGRSQQGHDPEELKKAWLDTLRLGLGPEKSAVLDGVDVVFPFYGDVLEKFVEDLQDAIPADIVVRGSPDGIEEEYRAFQGEAAEAIAGRLGLTDAQIGRFVEGDVQQRGVLNWPWVQALLRAADVIPGISAKAIEAILRDVYVYLSRSKVRQTVNDIVDAAIPSGRTVVIGHSLGSVVAYDLLVKAKRPLDIPLYLTVGCPIGIGPIRRTLAPLRFPASIGHWYNALDTRDVVALYPLDAEVFPVVPPVENYTEVHNGTENNHGIAGYLNDPVVAQRIHDALV